MTLQDCLSLLERERHLVLKDGDYAWSINAYRGGLSYEDLSRNATVVWRVTAPHWTTWNQVIGELKVDGGLKYPILYQPTRMR